MTHVDLPMPACDHGYTREQIESIVGTGLLAEFDHWMRGQTMTLCDGRIYSHSTREFEASCGPHGPVVYRHDLERYLRRLPVID